MASKTFGCYINKAYKNLVESTLKCIEKCEIYVFRVFFLFHFPITLDRKILYSISKVIQREVTLRYLRTIKIPYRDV